MKSKNRRWLFIWAIIYSIVGILHCEFVKNSTSLLRHPAENSTKVQDLRSVFAPRMDYEQWTPIGRGDPLKNDPTYDYVPPILDRVHYWIDPSSRKPDPDLSVDVDSIDKASANDKSMLEQNQKKEILILGVSSKKPSLQPSQADSRRDVYDSYVKYIDHAPPKYQQNHYQRERIFYPYSHYFPPHPSFYKSKHERYKNSHQVPYTILMPPPLPTTDRPTTESSMYQDHHKGVTVQQSSLIYHSSTLSDTHLQSLKEGDHENYHTADSTSVTWRTPLILPHSYSHDKTTMRPSFALSTSGYKMGKVENANVDAYVNIGKTEAHIHPDQGNLFTLLKKEIKDVVKPDELNPDIPSTMTSFLANIPKATTKAYTTTTTTTPTPPSTTMFNTLTTDPLFKHYRQPMEPLRGPMYLIIQGHSKVKTYGPAKQLFGVNVQEMNAITNYDNYKEFPVKHLHTYRKKEEYQPATYRNGRTFDNLAEVVQIGHGALQAISDINDANEIEVKETEVASRFNVAPNVGNATEVYHKGIVEPVVKTD